MTGWFILVACIGFVNVAKAELWELKGSLGQKVQYNDNIALRVIKQAATGYLLTPNFQAGYKTGTLEIGLNGGADIRRYDDPLWNCDNFNLGLDNRYLTKRSVFALSGGYGQSCSYSQQIKETGIVIPNSFSENFNLAPSWSWQWTPRDQLKVAASYSKTTFSNNAINNVDFITGSGPTGFSNYDTYSINLGIKHIWSQRLSFNGGLYATKTQYKGNNASTQNIFGFQLGGQYLISKAWTVNIGGGILLADIQQSSVSTLSSQNDSPDLGNTANIGVSYKNQLSDFTIGYSNDVSPSSIGQTLQNHSIFAAYLYQFTYHISLKLSSSMSRSETLGGQSTGIPVTGFSRDFVNANIALIWEFERDWQLSGSYAYQWQKYKQEDTTMDSNSVMISLNYNWGGIRY